jgi:two-component system cell cycle response regulator DivK
MTATDKVVLVIEDNASNMRLCHELLKSRGYTVLLATDGLGGWRMARDNRPDVIVMDIQLPDISGLEVVQWLKEDEKLMSIPIIALTAFATAEDGKSFLKKGCDGYIPKPISINDFLDAVDSFANDGV